jgi:hypothetical protein
MLPVAEHLIAKGRQLGPVPQYTSPEGPARPVGLPRWLAAVLVAAEAWRTWTDPVEVAWRLRVEIDAAGRDDDEAGGVLPRTGRPPRRATGAIPPAVTAPRRPGSGGRSSARVATQHGRRDGSAAGRRPAGEPQPLRRLQGGASTLGGIRRGLRRPGPAGRVQLGEHPVDRRQ